MLASLVAGRGLRRRAAAALLPLLGACRPSAAAVGSGGCESAASGSSRAAAPDAEAGHGMHQQQQLEEKEEKEGEEGERHSHVTVDRSGLWRPRAAFSSPLVQAQGKGAASRLTRHLQWLVAVRGGPLSVAEYMQEALVHPREGFYTSSPQVFGPGGHFVTAPEMSQLFGEMVGVWCMATWQQLGRPSRLQLVELGPGRGTLMADVLRCTAPFTDFHRALEVHLVEVSSKLAQVQRTTLTGEATPGAEPAGEELRPREGVGTDSATAAGKTRWGPSVQWHMDISQIPTDVPSLFLAHEFFDALPVHQFRRTGDRGWVELLVDINDDPAPTEPFRMVLSPRATIPAKLLVPFRLKGLSGEKASSIQALEISATALACVRQIAGRVANPASPSAALIMDYGDEGPFEHSLQAIRHHQFVGLFDAPGSSDLSAYVDFGSLRMATEQETAGQAVAHGPANQGDFLHALGVTVRLQQLLKKASPEQAKSLYQGYCRLVSGSDGAPNTAHSGSSGGTSTAHDTGEKTEALSNQSQTDGDDRMMGVRHKVMAILPASLQSPVGFPDGSGMPQAC